jgi:hypothetical protein
MSTTDEAKELEEFEATLHLATLTDAIRNAVETSADVQAALNKAGLQPVPLHFQYVGLAAAKKFFALDIADEVETTTPPKKPRKKIARGSGKAKGPKAPKGERKKIDRVPCAVCGVMIPAHRQGKGKHKHAHLS